MSLLLKYLLEKKLIKSKEEIKHKTPLEIAREKLDYGEFKKIIKEIYKLKYIENPQINVDEELIKRLDKKIIEEYKVLPIARRGKFLIVSTLEPDKSNEILDIFKILFPQYYVEIILIDPLILSKEIKKYIGSEKEEKQTFKLENIEIEPLSEFIEEKREDVETLIKDTPIVRFLDKLFEESISKRATDIHIEPYENKLRVRFRIDGILHTILETSKTYHSGVVARIKSLANLDIGERRKIQDGRFEIKINNKVIDVRVSIIPSIFGEKAVLRLLDKEKLEFSLDKLGFEEKSLKIVKKILKYPYGFILVTGPTGSGKTTTLYSMLSVLNKEDKHILTVEDPVEYYFKGINQFFKYVESKAYKIQYRVMLSRYRGKTICPECKGEGTKPEKPCNVCRGEGRIKDYEKIKIFIPPGVDSNQVIKLNYRGDAGRRGGKPGDLYVRILVKKHPVFQRRGDNLYVSALISFSQAALGGEIEIPTLEGKKILLKVPAGTESGKILRVSGKGIPHFSGFGRGNMYVELIVKTPKRLTKKQKELLKKLKEEGM